MNTKEGKGRAKKKGEREGKWEFGEGKRETLITENLSIRNLEKVILGFQVFQMVMDVPGTPFLLCAKYQTKMLCIMIFSMDERTDPQLLKMATVVVSS